MRRGPLYLAAAVALLAVLGIALHAWSRDDPQHEGRPIVTAVFPDTDHGIIEFEERDGERMYTRYAEGYYAMMVEWIRRGTVTGPYGRALRPLR